MRLRHRHPNRSVRHRGWNFDCGGMERLVPTAQFGCSFAPQATVAEHCKRTVAPRHGAGYRSKRICADVLVSRASLAEQWPKHRSA